MSVLWIALVVIILLVARLLRLQLRGHGVHANGPKKPLRGWRRKLYPVIIFAKISTKRYFRDKTAIFFTIAFPLIFLFVFGGIFGKNPGVSFKIAVIDQSQTPFATQFAVGLRHNKLFKVDSSVSTFAQADNNMEHGSIDAAVVLPPGFGAAQSNTTYPSGQAIVRYSQNNAQAAKTLASVLADQFQAIDVQLLHIPRPPLSVTTQQTGKAGLTQFDYTFSGLVGFAILGLGIFGPVNVFPELKKQGVLRRFHTTPLRVWQYFLANMLSQAVIGLISVAVMLVVALSVFHLKMVGNYFELSLFVILSIVLILGIGLAVGGWARNERQAAPLGNIVTFPMMFLSGTFFPRYLMPQWLQHITNYLPLTPVIDGIRFIATEGKDLTTLGPQVGIMAVWLIVIYAIAFRVFRWE
ncbi:MAG TPA: ABC transporter permease [Candidatus Saccharimonadales bacterium]|nr:ABC transporter permease [Candidatus Saccharimonadales bacterium]